MPNSQGSSSASIQAKYSKFSPKEIGGFSVHSDCNCVSLRGLGSSVVSLTAASTLTAGVGWSLLSNSLTAASISTAEVCWTLTSVTFEFPFLSGSGLADVMLSVVVFPFGN